MKGTSHNCTRRHDGCGFARREYRQRQRGQILRGGSGARGRGGGCGCGSPHVRASSRLRRAARAAVAAARWRLHASANAAAQGGELPLVGAQVRVTQQLFRHGRRHRGERRLLRALLLREAEAAARGSVGGLAPDGHREEHLRVFVPRVDLRLRPAPPHAWTVAAACRWAGVGAGCAAGQGEATPRPLGRRAAALAARAVAAVPFGRGGRASGAGAAAGTTCT